MLYTMCAKRCGSRGLCAMGCARCVAVVLGINTVGKVLWFLWGRKDGWIFGSAGQCGWMDRGVLWFYGVERMAGFLVRPDSVGGWMEGFCGSMG